MTALELAKAVALEHEIVLPDAMAEYLLWEHTGFPSFFEGGETPEQGIRRQLTELFKADLGRWRHEYPLGPRGLPAHERLDTL